MLVDLLQQVFKSSLHGSSGIRSFGLHRHLSRRQSQVQRNAGTFTRGDLLYYPLQMDEFRAEDLQSFLQFFDLMLNIFFYGGNFMKTITDVNVHERLGFANEVRATKSFLSRIVHPVQTTETEK